MSFQALTETINLIAQPDAFLTNMLIGGKEKAIFAESVKIPTKTGGRRMAPFTKAGTGGTVVEGYAEKTVLVEFPTIRPKTHVSATDFAKFVPAGMPNVYRVGQSTGDVGRTALQELQAERAMLLKNIIANTKEWCLAQLLQAGKFTLINPENKYGVTIDYGLAAGQLPVLSSTARWGESAADIIKDLRTWNRAARRLTGNPALNTVCVMGHGAVDLFLKDTAVKALLDNRRVLIGQLEPKLGAKFLGSFMGMDFYEYDGTVTLPDGTSAEVWGEYKVALFPPDIFSVLYGTIHDFGPNQTEAQVIVGKEFMKQETEFDPSGLWFLAESRPVHIIDVPEGIVCATVR